MDVTLSITRIFLSEIDQLLKLLSENSSVLKHWLVCKKYFQQLFKKQAKIKKKS